MALQVGLPNAAVLLCLLAAGCVTSQSAETETASLSQWVGEFYVEDGRWASPETCTDPLENVPDPALADFWSVASQPNTCYQVAATPIADAGFDCSDGIPPDGPKGVASVPGVEVVVDVRNSEILVWSHEIGVCVPDRGP